MNSVNLTGRLTKDPEYHETDSGMQICRFQIAVDRITKQGEEKKADFPRIVTFGKLAETCNKYISKGKMVGISGHLQTGSYEKEDGQKVYTTDVIADRVDFLSPMQKEESPSDDFQTLNEDVPF